MKRLAAFIKNHLGTIAIIVVFLLVYGYTTRHKLIDTFLFPPPEKIGASFAKYFPTLLLGMVHSFRLLLPGFVLGIIIAFLLGLPMGLNKAVRENLHPIVYAVSVIPAILLTPFAIHIFASFAVASRFLIVYSTIWPTLFSVTTGVMTIDKRYLDNAATLEIAGAKRMFFIILPAAMPSIMSGLVMSLRNSFVALVYAEMFGAKYGMGYFVQYYSDLGRYENVMSGFIFLVFVLVIVMQLFEHVKTRTLKWTLD